MPLRRLILIAALMIFTLGGHAMGARGPQNIQNTPHNLSTSATLVQYQADTEDEICIFCHTPHGGSNTGQLWNRENPDTTTYSYYTSATISAEVAGVGSISNESLLCLSCHDGSLSMYMVKNASNGTGGQPENGGMPDGKMPNLIVGFQTAYIGTDLSDDHPISFSYSDVKTEYGVARANELKDLADAKTNGVRFFGAGEDMVECSSCHDPHVDYDAFDAGTGDSDYKPFLIMPNTGSALCLACHTK